MAKYKKTGTLDGYSTIKAIARATKNHPAKPAGTRKKAARPEPVVSPSGKVEPSKPADYRELGANVARTVMPEKHLVECYECGYTFQLHGRAKKINCSKCRLILDLEDRTIEGKWSEDLKTAGRIRIGPAAIIQHGKIIGQDVVLDGTVEGGSVRAMRRLEIGSQAVFGERSIRAVDLTIGPEAKVRFKKPAHYREVEIHGSLRADLTASGQVRIYPLGLLEGKFSGGHLVIEEGGGLKAEVELREPGTEPESEPETEPESDQQSA